MPKIKNIVIFITIGAILVFIYLYFIKPSSNPDNLISVISSVGGDAMASVGDSTVARDFLTLLLNVKNIKLDDTIFSDNAFTSLHDSSITITQDGTEGRPNPFAPLGVDNIASPIIVPIISDISPVVPVTPAPTIKP